MDELSQVKQSARAAWDAGDFRPFAELLGPSRAGLTARLAIAPGDVVLDVGCGTGELAVEAARCGAAVTGLDISPQMLLAARRLADEAGVEVRWQEGDAEDLPAESGSVDVVMSSFGCMFAPRHAVTAHELARVLRPGGRMGVLTWPTGGDIAAFMGVAAVHMPPPPAIAEPPRLWGDEDHVHAIFAGTGLELSIERGTMAFHFRSAAEAAEIYATQFGPLVAARALLEPQGRWQALADDVAAYFARHTSLLGDGVMLHSDYMMILGRAPD